jgi:hypothetical protein
MFIQFSNIDDFNSWLTGINNELNLPSGKTLSYTSPIINEDGVRIACQIDNRIDTSQYTTYTKDQLFADKFFCDVRRKKIKQIDENTERLIETYFTFDSLHFSMSPNAQKNWSDLKLHQDILTWPYEVSTYEGGSYNLELADLNNFIIAAATHKTTHLASGRALRQQVIDAQTIAEIDAIEDSRT